MFTNHRSCPLDKSWPKPVTTAATSTDACTAGPWGAPPSDCERRKGSSSKVSRGTPRVAFCRNFNLISASQPTVSCSRGSCGRSFREVVERKMKGRERRTGDRPIRCLLQRGQQMLAFAVHLDKRLARSAHRRLKHKLICISQQPATKHRQHHHPQGTMLGPLPGRSVQVQVGHSAMVSS